MLSEARRAPRVEWNLAGCVVLTGTCSLPGGQCQGLPLHGRTPACDRGAEQHRGCAEGTRRLRPGSRAVQVSSIPLGWEGEYCGRPLGSVLLLSALDLFPIAGAESSSHPRRPPVVFSPARPSPRSALTLVFQAACPHPARSTLPEAVHHGAVVVPSFPWAPRFYRLQGSRRASPPLGSPLAGSSRGWCSYEHPREHLSPSCCLLPGCSVRC